MLVCGYINNYVGFGCESGAIRNEVYNHFFRNARVGDFTAMWDLVAGADNNNHGLAGAYNETNKTPVIVG